MAAPKSGMTSLYANLLDPESGDAATADAATISPSPVTFSQAARDGQSQEESTAKKQQISAAALRFQPTKRPQLSAQKPKPKPSFPRGIPSDATSTTTIQNPATRNSLADWTTNDDDDVNGFFAGESRPRGGRKKRKKNRETIPAPQDWDDIYDPSRPNNYEEYRNSDEKIREVREWKDRLYAHRTRRSMSSDMESEEENISSISFNRQFAPPPDFASSLPPPAPIADIPDDATGEDAYARRMRLSGFQSGAAENVYSSPIQRPEMPSQSPPSNEPGQTAISSIKPEIPSSISRAPVIYQRSEIPGRNPPSTEESDTNLREEDIDMDTDDQEGPRSLRPGQKGFAERLMAKYGWKKGSGLGANESGIVNPLRVQVEKRKKKPDSEGGGFVGPGGRGKIIGGKKPAANSSEDMGRFGAMSDVVVLFGMLEGLDVEAELQSDGGGGLMQEIGEECGEKYGRVERVFIHREGQDAVPIFIKFTSQLSALRAVNDLEGRIFNGNSITAKFYDTEKFEKGIYDWHHALPK